MPAEPFERLLLAPDAVRRQLDPAGGCGPACVEMVLRLESGDGGPLSGHGQSSLAAWCRAARGANDRASRWATNPAALQHLINAQPPPDRPRPRGLQRYHIVHSASATGPVEEILTWMRGHRTADRHVALPSCLLMRHGTHWMLAVGACVTTEGLIWMAVADPLSGRLICLTRQGLAELFTPNLVGDHPDWIGRHVAVIPNVLPRPVPADHPPIAPDDLLHSTPPSPAHHSPQAPEPTHHPVPDPHASFLDSVEELRVLQTLAGFARHARHPLASRWLAQLATGRHIVVADPPDRSSASLPPGASRRAWVLDAACQPVAEIRLRTTPASLLHCTTLSPTPA